MKVRNHLSQTHGRLLHVAVAVLPALEQRRLRPEQRRRGRFYLWNQAKLGHEGRGPVLSPGVVQPALQPGQEHQLLHFLLPCD